MCMRKSISLITFLIFTNVVFRVHLLEIPSENEIEPGTMNATEQLLELIVKISADPHHWRQALNLIEKTKNKVEAEKTDKEVSNKSVDQDIEELRNLAKDREKPRYYYSYNSKKSQKNNNSTLTFSKIKKVRNDNETIMGNTKNINSNDQQILQNKESTLSYQKFKSQARNYPVLNKRPKGYIAVSLIAPKPLRKDSILDQELKYLKHWPHKVQQK